MTTLTAAPSRSDKVRQAKQSLDEHVQALAEQMRQGKSENLIRYLEFSSRFHCYSFGNMLLAIFQREGITRLAGLRQWNKLGRHVKAGEKGIMILAPMTVWRKSDTASEPASEDETTESERAETRDHIMIFKPVYVFDVSQTDGAELPSMIHASGDVASLLPALRQSIKDADIALEIVETIALSSSALGVSCGGQIEIRSDLSEPDAFRTLAHEFAHELLHWPKDGEAKERGKEAKTLRETEADAAAFVVCRHFGIETDTADYLLLYDSDPRLLLDRLETIRQTACRIIEAIEDRLPIPALQHSDAEGTS